MERRLMAGRVHLRRLPASSRMLKKMGPLQGVMKLVPGMGRQLDGLEIDDRQMARVEAIVLSMTPHERRTPHLINGPRRRRIAAGGHHHRGRQPPAPGAQADGEGHEVDGEGEDADPAARAPGSVGPGGAAGRPRRGRR